MCKCPENLFSLPSLDNALCTNCRIASCLESGEIYVYVLGLRCFSGTRNNLLMPLKRTLVAVDGAGFVDAQLYPVLVTVVTVAANS
jgi:hypothetical protein